MGLGLRDLQYASCLEFADKWVNLKTFFFFFKFTVLPCREKFLFSYNGVFLRMADSYWGLSTRTEAPTAFWAGTLLLQSLFFKSIFVYELDQSI